MGERTVEANKKRNFHFITFLAAKEFLIFLTKSSKYKQINVRENRSIIAIKLYSLQRKSKNTSNYGSMGNR